MEAATGRAYPIEGHLQGRGNGNTSRQGSPYPSEGVDGRGLWELSAWRPRR